MGMFERTELLLGAEAMGRLRASTVAIFGLGGVGSYAAEALVRSGIERFVLVDGDTVALSNINRQIIAVQSTVGLPKAGAARERMLSINPGARVDAVNMFVSEENIAGVLHGGRGIDYAVDAIDDIGGKLAIIGRCAELGIRVVSSMGAGNKLRPERFKIADIYETKVCPLAKAMRKKLRERGVGSLDVCYSDEEPAAPRPDALAGENGRRPVGSVSFVPAAAGLVIAGHVVRQIAVF